MNGRAQHIPLTVTVNHHRLGLALVLGVRSERIGNPVRFRGCPAAVSENDLRHTHWPVRLGSGGQ